jgi:hypothetical protein
MCEVDPTTIRRWIKRGLFPGARRHGLRAYRIPLAAVKALLPEEVSPRC